MLDAYQSLSHSRWNCKYHVVFVPKRRRKTLFGKIRQATWGRFFTSWLVRKSAGLSKGI